MRCSKCNYELDENGKCHHCEEKENPNIHVISQEEIVAYHGVTIDEQGDYQQKTRSREEHRQNPYGRIYVKNIGLKHTSWLAKISIFLILTAIAAFVVFIALPLALVGIGVGLLIWLILRFIRR